MPNPMPETRWWPLVRRLGCLLHSWWTCDRIRVSPDEGKMFRLQPGSWLVLDDEAFEVVERQVHRQTVVYSCRGRHSSLRVVIEVQVADPMKS